TAAWNSVKENLETLADSVQGTILSVPSMIYDEWDMNPCNTNLPNTQIAEPVREKILDYVRSGTQFVTLVGNDKVIPFYRVPDATSISNERNYVLESRTKPGTADFARLFESQNLTDDFYVDDNEFINDTSLIIPKWSISRLVENPDEIISSIEAFLANNQQINLSSAMVSGYDIFDDGAESSSSYLAELVGAENVTKYISPLWEADDIGCDLLGSAYSENCLSTDVSSGVSNFNAHFSHFFFQSAYGYNEIQPDFLFSNDIKSSASGEKILSGRLAYTVGCHSGYNVPDGHAKEFVVTEINPNHDFSQAVAKQGGVLVGSTGYGLAGIESVAGTEKLLALFSEELVKNSTIGMALVKAKQRYFTSLRSASDVTPYDVKSTIQTTLYGLPMYGINGASESLLMASNSSTTSTSSSMTIDVDVTETSGAVIEDGNYPYEEVDTNSGYYYQVNNQHHSIPTRPVQPKMVIDIPDGVPVHGVLVKAGSYDDINNFDPVYSRPTTEWSRGVKEESYCQNGYWPSTLANINYYNNSSNLVIIPGQFSCDNIDSSGIATGSQRLYKQLALEVLRHNSQDFYPPDINSVDLQDSGNGTTSVIIDATDNESGIARIVVLIQENGQLTAVDSGQLSGSGPYSIDLGQELGSITNQKKLILQVVDGANNVSNWTAKGKGIREIQVQIADEAIYSNIHEKILTATIPEFTDLLNEADSIAYIWDFGDGELESGILAKQGVATDLVNPYPDGTSASFSISHYYAGNQELTAKLKITDSAGGIGSDEINLSFCGDPNDNSENPDGDLVQCDVTSDNTQVTITVKVADGGVIAPDFQYRLYLDYDNDGNSDLKLTYDNGTIGKTKKVNDLAATTYDDQYLEISFDLAPTGWTPEIPLNWYMETQSGIEKGKSKGFLDMMPDNGYFTY
ncbi:MAG: hypothetical protein PVJ63_10005, partial [Thioalkalispiraceae bacterium]